MPVLQIVVEDELADKIQKQAQDMGHSVSSFGRFIFRQWVDADAVTLERARHLTDAAYETEEE